MPIPRAKTTHGITDTVLPQSLCGQNWFQSIQVKNAYKGYNKESRTLASLGTKAQLGAREEGVTEQIEAERKRVTVMRHQHFPDLLSSTQKSNIDKYLDRARLYIEDAVSLEDAWRSGFIFWVGSFGSSQTIVMPFPLSIDLGDIQNGFCINNYGHKAKNQWEANCPTAEEHTGHDKDAGKWRKLMVAAVINIRCAEEVVRKAEVKEANRLAKPAIGSLATEPKTSGIGGLKSVPLPAIPVPMPTIPEEPVSNTSVFNPTVDAVGETDEGVADGIIDEVDDGDVPDDMVEEDGEGALEEEVKVSKKKKKSNAPLIAAAGIGALLLFGK